MAQLKVLCGFIGSGKTTYAQNKFKVFTDLDYLPQYSRKADQINLTLKLLETNDLVCHITTFPTNEELLAFQKLDVEYLFMDTSIEQCKTNILIRNRPRDMQDLGRVFKANIVMRNKLRQCPHMFKFIKVF